MCSFIESVLLLLCTTLGHVTASTQDTGSTQLQEEKYGLSNALSLHFNCYIRCKIDQQYKEECIEEKEESCRELEGFDYSKFVSHGLQSLISTVRRMTSVLFNTSNKINTSLSMDNAKETKMAEGFDGTDQGKQIDAFTTQTSPGNPSNPLDRQEISPSQELTGKDFVSEDSQNPNKVKADAVDGAPGNVKPSAGATSVVKESSDRDAGRAPTSVSETTETVLAKKADTAVNDNPKSDSVDGGKKGKQEESVASPSLGSGGQKTAPGGLNTNTGGGAGQMAGVDGKPSTEDKRSQVGQVQDGQKKPEAADGNVKGGKTGNAQDSVLGTTTAASVVNGFATPRAAAVTRFQRPPAEQSPGLAGLLGDSSSTPFRSRLVTNNARVTQVGKGAIISQIRTQPKPK